MPEGHPDRRIRQVLHPGKQGWRPDPDLASPPDRRASDRNRRRQAARHDALDQGQQAGRQDPQLITALSRSAAAVTSKVPPSGGTFSWCDGWALSRVADNRAP